jgi:lipoate-protein ligase A
MAVDEAIFHLWRPGDPIVVRVYGWKPTGLSIGRSQRLSDVNVEAATSMGWCVVRRPTGGGALVHPEGGEVTYSVVLPTTYPGMPEGVEESAAWIASAIAKALKSLGIPAEVKPTPYRRGVSLCYARGGSSSVYVHGVRVSGSAQLRTRDKLLQHGTLLLAVDYQSWSRALKLEPDLIRRHVAGLRDLGYHVDTSELVAALRKAFEDLLGVKLATAELSPAEELLAKSLFYKYASQEWLRAIA